MTEGEQDSDVDYLYVEAILGIIALSHSACEECLKKW